MFESQSSQNILKPNEKSTYHQPIIKLSSNYHQTIIKLSYPEGFVLQLRRFGR